MRKLPIKLLSDLKYYTGFFLFFLFFFVELHLWHMEVHGKGAESELQLPAYATATAMPDLRSTPPL